MRCRGRSDHDWSRLRGACPGERSVRVNPSRGDYVGSAARRASHLRHRQHEWNVCQRAAYSWRRALAAWGHHPRWPDGAALLPRRFSIATSCRRGAQAPDSIALAVAPGVGVAGQRGAAWAIMPSCLAQPPLDLLVPRSASTPPTTAGRDARSLRLPGASGYLGNRPRGREVHSCVPVWGSCPDAQARASYRGDRGVSRRRGSVSRQRVCGNRQIFASRYAFRYR